ncbi:FtsX-like permease family protein [Pedococcus sp. KACC 23699]|uniref:FtsX-like permease family protein n=1 Tax=Pedococcus sp. KACC 23699 TaxID=3149228 RepID=A0AAU7JUW8_9MICO
MALWAAIRYRRAQALPLVVLSALIATCAVFAPLYERALEQSLLRSTIDQAPITGTALSVRGGRSERFPTRQPGDLADVVPPVLRGLYMVPFRQMQDSIFITPRHGLLPSPVRLLSRSDVCAHLTVRGRCPQTPGEVLVSSKDASTWSWRLGRTFDTPVPGTGSSTSPGQAQRTARLTVVGVYAVRPNPAYWLGTQLDGKSGVPTNFGSQTVPGVDDLVTTEATFDPTWVHVGSTLIFPLRAESVTMGNLDRVTSALQPRVEGVPNGHTDVVVQSELPAFIATVEDAQGQLRVIVPLLTAQLALLGAAILVLVARAAVDQRRPEAALARLRGRSREGAGRLVITELGLTVLLGLPVGAVAAVVLSEVVRRRLLADGVPFEVSWIAIVGLLASAVVCVLAVVVAARPLQRQSISALLRRVSPARRVGLGIVDLLAVALAGFGLVGLATRALQGPLALLTPTLVALAGGLVASRAAVPIARSVGRTNLRRGRIGPALAAYGLERRPAMRTVVTVVSVAVSLTVFAANALVVADRNWVARAQLTTGAPVVLDTDSSDPTKLAGAVQGIDPSGRRVLPVAVVRQTAQGSTPTMAVIGSTFDQVAFSPAGAELRTRLLRPPAVATVPLVGQRVTGHVTWETRSTADPLDASGTGDAATPVVVRLDVTTTTGRRLTRDVVDLPATGAGSKDFSTPLLCPAGCRLDGIGVVQTDPLSKGVVGTVTIAGLGIDDRRLDVDDVTRWNPFTPLSSGTHDDLRLTFPTSDTLRLAFRSSGVTVRVSYADVPAQLPGLLAGPVPPGGTAKSFQAIGLNGAPMQVTAVQRPAALPVLGTRGVMVDYRTLARLGGPLGAGGTLSVWLREPGQEQAVRAALGRTGIGVTTAHHYDDAKARIVASGSGWGVRLALFSGAMAVVLAALVVIVIAATGWRVVARDLAALHMSGVRLGVLRRSLVREQVLVVTLGTVVGAVCGVTAAALAMPLLPLFDDASTPVPALQIAPSITAVLGATLVALVVLILAALAAALSSGSRVTLSRIRETL